MSYRFWQGNNGALLSIKPVCWHLLMFSPPDVSLNNRHNRLLTDLIACELDSRVVLNLPQALVEAFSLVGLAKFVFILLVWQKILRAQECTSEGGRHIYCYYYPKIFCTVLY